MTKPVSIQQRIRILDAQGVSWREIARRLGVSRDTVRKYATMEDCSPKPAVRKGRRSLIDAYSGTVDSWLFADRLMPRKQRHTARRVYARLVEEEGFEGSYSSVQRYVKRWREEHRSDGDGYLELDWSAGVMQVDFGEAVATIGGGDVKVHCLVATFPHSNMRYVAAMPGENAECVCEGLAQIFDHIGMVPRVLVLDNATGAGHRVAWNKVTVVRVFAMFCDHYRLETRFCNPYSGNEKGSVENAVGFLRRNLMVPKPNAESHRQLTRHLLSRCDAIADVDHYRSGRPVRELFDEDRGEMQPLPRARFDAVEWVERKADKEGNIQIGSVRYLAGPSWRGWTLLAGLRAFEVEIRTADGRHVNTLPRCLCSISCCGFSHDDFSGLGRACRPRNGLNWMVLVSPPERTGKDYDQHAPSTVYPSFAAERGIRRVDRAENTCRRSRRCVSTSRRRICRPCRR